jgi:hypothetical protein
VSFALVLAGTLAGASYSTDVLLGLVKFPAPFRAQVTPLPEESFCTNAVTVIDWPAPMVCELLPPKLTETSGGG